MPVNYAALARRRAAGREAILDTLLALLARGRSLDVSFRELAEEAGVSERTIYRYFEDRDALCAAMVPIVHARLEHIAPPPDPAGLPDYVERLYRICEANAGLVQSLLHTPVGRSILAGVRAERVAAVRRLVETVAPGRLSPEVAAAGATIRYLASGTAWEFYRFQAGLDLEEAIAAARWSVTTLLAAAHQPPAPTSRPQEITRPGSPPPATQPSRP